MNVDVVMVVVGVMVVVVEGILNTMELLVIILPIKGKLQCTTRSGIILRQSKMRSMSIIRLPRAMRIHGISGNVSTISGTSNLIEGSGRASIRLPKGTRFHINDALYSSKSTRNLFSFKDIRRNRYHIETINGGNKECLYITSIVYDKKLVVEILSAFSTGLYHITIKSIELYVVVNQKFNDPKTFVLWHDMLGHPGSSMMRRIIENSQGHELKN